MKKLYIEFRVHFDPSTNQELLDELANEAQDAIYTMFEQAQIGEEDMPSVQEVTYEIVMEVPQSDEVKS